jgi:alpha-glucosidase
VSGEWWRHAVIYQIYPRSFADADGDGVGDLRGITDRIVAIKELGVDAVWLSPFFTSPQRDAGYDVADYCDVDPLFGSLADFDELLARAHELSLRVIVDLVPNHTSDQHSWFRDALAAGPGSTERARYLFRDGKGATGELPPNNWESVFGGPAWDRVTEADGRPGQWYLHLFDSSQPDLDWTNPQVQHDFENILRFWLDRGVDGFRVDVAHGLAKAEGLPDRSPELSAESALRIAPYWGQPAVHDIYRQWHDLLAQYDGDRVLCAEAWAPTLHETARWVRPDEMHQAFNFVFMETPWDAAALKDVIAASLAEFTAVEAPATWVLSNHDIIRHATRLALNDSGTQGYGIGPDSGIKPDVALGLRRARAATALMLALPGSAYLYQGEELGLPEVIDIPDGARQDPTWLRSKGQRYGRDGCRVPLPWSPTGPSYGFSTTAHTWLPQPDDWQSYARETQQADPESTLNLYIQLLELRRKYSLGTGALTWNTPASPHALSFTTGMVTVIANFGPEVLALPAHAKVLINTAGRDERAIAADATVWYLSAE